MSNPASPSRALVAEGLGTALLLIAVVGSGIMAERLAGGNDGLALLANTAATAAALIVLILVFGPVSGAHFNPAVTLAMALRRRLRWGAAGPYVVVQILGGILGVIIAHAMFELPAILPSHKVRFGGAQLLAEFVATFGLLGTIWAVVKHRPDAIAYAVAAWIAGAYWFTASTSFANPAVTIARSLSNTFAGIRPIDAPGFILAQLVGAGAATLLFRWLLDETD